MAVNPLLELAKVGQSVWYDQMRRALLKSGELAKLIKEDGLRGLTSNPTIFEKAIGGSSDYAEALDELASKGASVAEIYQNLVVADIGNAADVFRGVHTSSEGVDGFCSLEVSPNLAFETEKTIEEAKKLFALLNRPNVMIKIPATPQGIPAIEECIAAGLNINVTLIFARDVYQQVAEAYVRGLERRAAAGQPVNHVGSVASFFVSRIDTAVERELTAALAAAKNDAERQRLNGLFGKVAIANAKLAYQSYRHIFHGERFAKLRALGARPQRQLWASTGTKNPKYSDVLYVEQLIGPETVNTLPPATFNAFRDHGKVALTLEKDVEQAFETISALEESGISLKAITNELTREGVESFAASFTRLLEVIEARRDEAMHCILQRHTGRLGKNESAFGDALKKLDSDAAISRIWKKDAALWKQEPEHQKIIKNALGWLTVVELMLEHVDDLVAFAKEIKQAGYKHVVVLGMGGSSLCPEVLRRTFGKIEDYPELLVLDSTVPAAIRDLESKIDVGKTIFIVASKSGTTTEPQMFHHYFYARVKEKLGDRAGQNFIAITDPGTKLAEEAAHDGFRRVFLNPADIGGRYSALSYFGMVPFALMGGSVAELLNRAHHAMHACSDVVPAAENPGARLGAEIGTLALAGHDKLTLVAAPPLSSVGLWIEQLIAESTGKEGKGIVPIAGEALAAPAAYSDDRIFVYLYTSNRQDVDVETKLKALEGAGHPVLRARLHDPLDLGEEFFLWEFATAIAGKLLGIDPFDQPNVQESKDNTKRLIGEFAKSGKLPEQQVVFKGDPVSVLADPPATFVAATSGASLADVIAAQLAQVKPHDYVALTAYIEETPSYEALIQQVRLTIRDRWKVATTTGYGPRFLHSTGQLHKGGSNSGVFLQITAHPGGDLAIPGEPFTFGLLKDAQALGDYQSLAQRNRRAVRLELAGGVEAGLRALLAAVQKVAAGQTSAA